MSNYSDNPSMDEILKRIKKALADREKRIEEEAFSLQENTIEEQSVSFEEMKEFSSRPEVGEHIVQNIVKDEIFIKPNLSNEKRDDVFVLTKDMKISSSKKLGEVNFNLLCEMISKEMSKDLAIAYLSPKIESWLRNNFWEFVSKASKK